VTPMLSVASTYHKVLLLVSRFIGYILAFSFTTRLLESCLPASVPHQGHDLLLAWLRLCAALVGLFFGAVTDAALLGILRQPDHAGRQLILSSVRAYTWVLFRLILLIGIIAVLAMAPFLVLVHWLHLIPLASFAVTFLYLVLIKYALAYPLAVDENLNAREALKRSWEMTRGHFWYVLFCYLLMAAAHIAMNQLFTIPWLDPSVVGSPPFFLKHLAEGFFDSLWMILGWQMYVEIKAADQASASEV
jgi:hypothetical protein